MSLKNKFFSIFALVAATFAFSAIGTAQEATTAPTDKAEKVRKGERRGFGGREYGRGEFGGKHGGRHGGPSKMGGKAMRMLHGIELTEVQKTQLHSIFEANKPAPESMTEIRTLATAKRDGTITAEQQERLTVLKQQGKEKAQSVKAQIEAILTPEQKAQIETKKAEMKLRMQERREQRQLRKQQTPATETTKTTKDN